VHGAISKDKGLVSISSISLISGDGGGEWQHCISTILNDSRKKPDIQVVNLIAPTFQR